MDLPTTGLAPRVGDLCRQLEEHVGAGAWTDCVLAAAGLWQASDDATGWTGAPLTVAAIKLRPRTDLLGRLVSLVLDAVLRIAATPSRLSRTRQRHLGRWRRAVTDLAVAAAGLATREAPTAGDPRVHLLRRLVAEIQDVPREVRTAVARPPSCFRSFDQHPDDVATLIRAFADRRPDRARPVVVVGIRTSGSYLAPFAVADLHRAGYADVSMVSARPDQRYAPEDARRLRAAAGKAGTAVVIDDPPASGNAVARVCAGLRQFGFPTESIVPVLALFDDSGPALEALSRCDPVTLPWANWSIHGRLERGQVARGLTAALAARSVRITDESPLPAGLSRTHAKRLYRAEITQESGAVETRTILAAGAGLGYFAAFDEAVSRALDGRVPRVLGRTDGVAYLDWPCAAQPVLPTPAEVTDYVSARHDLLAVTDDPTDGLRGSQPVWEVGSNHLARVYGRFWPLARVAFVDRLTRGLLGTASPSLPDGDMRPAAWLAADGSERPLKTSFAERTFSNFDLISFDDRFDVVGAAVHGADPGYARALQAGYEEQTGRRISPERWLVYELVHLWDLERLGEAAPESVRARKSQAVRHYLARTVLGDVTAAGYGPVVALDVDGVLETDLLGFPAPTPTGVLALRALHVHGYRTVLVTGRCLDDVVELAEVFGLAGGAAEYGSVLHEQEAASSSTLVTREELDLLAKFRADLFRRPAVRIDSRYRFSVRASAVDHRSRLRGCVPPPSSVPAGLRAIPGEAQTDFVAARVDKLLGARTLVRQLGEERPVLAVGDTVADARLLEWAQLSVAPRHADAAARAAATRVSRRPYQGGLADAVGALIGHPPGSCAECAPPAASPDTQTMLRLLQVSEASRLRAVLRSVPLLRAEFRGGR
jgi:hypothetical protein